MIKVVSVENMRQIEAAADAAGFSYDAMMQNAGAAAARRAQVILSGQAEARVTVLVGPGNNGGDGLVAGRLLALDKNIQVRCYLLKRRDDTDANFTAVKDADLFIAYAEDDRDGRVLRNMVASAHLVVDALFGIGVRLPLKNDAAKVLRNVVQAVNDDQQPEHPEGAIITPDTPNTSRFPRPYVLAIDCPSGLNCDTGELDKNAIHADETITFIAAKPGLLEFPGAGAVGQLHIATIGLPIDLPALKNENNTLVDGHMVRGLLPGRSADANKGTFGKALIVAGSTNFMGAPGLSALAAYRVGVGLVTVGAPQPVIDVISSHLFEPTWLMLPHDMGALAANAVTIVQKEMAAYDSLLLGPGWGREQTTREFLTTLLNSASETAKPHAQRSIGFMEKAADAESKPDETPAKLPALVIDADGLNLLSELDEWWKLLPENTVITPHPGEMGRLAKMETRDILANRWDIVRAKAAEWNVILVLKGAHTLIAAPDGRVAVLPFKTDVLAKAGTGDVLAGMITGLLAQGMSAYDAALAGGYIHGLAGTLAARKSGTTRSLIASEVADAVAEVFSLIEAR
ncbi:MAG: bifunctional ADP-dependent NAD(P)H-hydrate dehydratase/NAD(P)H-hydrate epimerase [Chloroflexota bacterium]